MLNYYFTLTPWKFEFGIIHHVKRTLPFNIPRPSDGEALNFTAWSSFMPSGDEGKCVAVTPEHAFFWTEHNCEGDEVFLPVCLKPVYTFNPCEEK